MVVDTAKGKAINEALADIEKLGKNLSATNNAVNDLIQRASAAKARLSSSARHSIRAVTSSLNTEVGQPGLEEVAASVGKNLHGDPASQLAEQEKDEWLHQLQVENRELREALDEFQCSIDLIMTKNRENLTSLRYILRLEQKELEHRLQGEQIENDQLRLENGRLRAKIEEMGKIMALAVETEEREGLEREARLVELETENKGLRELLSISSAAFDQPATNGDAGSKSESSSSAPGSSSLSASSNFIKSSLSS